MRFQLNDQFLSRGQHQRPGIGALGVRKFFQQGQHIRRRFTGSGLRDADNRLTSQHQWNHPPLDFCGVIESQFGHGAKKLRVQLQLLP